MAARWDRRSLSEQRRIRSLLLEDWLGATAAFSPFWGEHLAETGVEPSSIRTVEDLQRLPSARERDLLGRGGAGSPALVLRPTEDQVKARANFALLRRVARDIRRSGLGGKRRALLTEFKPVQLVPSGRDGDLTLAYTRADLDRLHRAGARAADVLGLGSDDYLVSVVPADRSLTFWSVYHLALGTSMLAAHAGDDVEAAVAAFARMPVTAVAAPAEGAAEWADLLAAEGVDLGRVRTVVLVGAPGDERGSVVEAWRAAGAASDARVLGLWSPPGVRALWGECAESAAGGAGTGFHTYPDLEVLELVGATGRPSPGGGDITYTSMGWNGTALIRYQTGDHAAGLVEDPCPACGRTVPRVVGPVSPGAWEPLLATGSGDVRIDLRGIAVVLSREDGIEAWRAEVRTSDRGADEYVVYVAGQPRDGLSHRLATAVGHPPVAVTSELRGELEERVAEVGGVFEDAR
ncbi:MAG: hypothetical protein ACRDUY_03865 [Nitriliruptorales bacterium]